MKLALFVHGRGRGHAARARELVAHLTALEISHVVFAAGQAREALAHLGDVRRTESLMPGARSLLRLPSLRDQTRMQIEDSQADIVVSDGHAPSVLAARDLHVPSIAVGHDVVFQLPYRVPPSARLALSAQRLNAWHTRFADEHVAAHFLPLPSTERTQVGRPLLAELNPSSCTDDGSVLVYVRDREMLAGLEPLRSVSRTQHCFGHPGATPDWMLDGGSDRAAFLERLHRAHAVVASAGSNVIAECLALQKPCLLLYRRRDPEQWLNVAAVELAELGQGCRLSQLDESTLGQFFERIGSFATTPLLNALPPFAPLVVEAARRLTGSFD